MKEKIGIAKDALSDSWENFDVVREALSILIRPDVDGLEGKLDIIRTLAIKLACTCDEIIILNIALEDMKKAESENVQ